MSTAQSTSTQPAPATYAFILLIAVVCAMTLTVWLQRWSYLFGACALLLLLQMVYTANTTHARLGMAHAYFKLVMGLSVLSVLFIMILSLLERYHWQRTPGGPYWSQTVNHGTDYTAQTHHALLEACQQNLSGRTLITRELGQRTELRCGHLLPDVVIVSVDTATYRNVIGTAVP